MVYVLYYKKRRQKVNVAGCSAKAMEHNVLQIGDCAEDKEPKLMEQIQIKNNNTDLHNVGIATNLRVMFSLLLRGCLI